MISKVNLTFENNSKNKRWVYNHNTTKIEEKAKFTILIILMSKKVIRFFFTQGLKLYFSSRLNFATTPPCFLRNVSVTMITYDYQRLTTIGSLTCDKIFCLIPFKRQL